MKLNTLILILLFSYNANASEIPAPILSDSAVNEIVCDNSFAIKDHMSRMGFIIRSLTGSVNSLLDGSGSEELRAEIMTNAQTLRAHLSAVSNKTPDKVKKIKEGDFHGSKLIFQRYILAIMEQTLNLEEELLIKPEDAEAEQEQSIKIAAAIYKIDSIVQSAHTLFRE